MVRSSQSTADLAASYAARTANLRDATKWLLAASAAVGGLLVAGLQLTTLGSLGRGDALRLAIAGAAVFVALAAVGYIVWLTSSLLTQEWLTLAQLHVDDFQGHLRESDASRKEKSERKIVQQVKESLQANADELYGNKANSISDLSSQLAAANAAARDGNGVDEVNELLATTTAVVQFANYERTRTAFLALRPRLAVAAVIAVIAVLLYSYTANPPAQPSPTQGPLVPGSSPSSQAPKNSITSSPVP